MEVIERTDHRHGNGMGRITEKKQIIHGICPLLLEADHIFRKIRFHDGSVEDNDARNKTDKKDKTVNPQIRLAFWISRIA